MNSGLLFSEKQRFTQWWFWLALVLINGVLIFGMVQQLAFAQPFGNKPISDSGLLIVAGSLLILDALLFFTQLQTRISENGIDVRLFPFHFKYKHFNWPDIENAYVRQYSPISEYGGWGLRYSLSQKGKAYNISGNLGLQLEFRDGKKLLIGTKKPEELKAILQQLEKSVTQSIR